MTARWTDGEKKMRRVLTAVVLVNSIYHRGRGGRVLEEDLAADPWGDFGGLPVTRKSVERQGGEEHQPDGMWYLFVVRSDNRGRMVQFCTLLRQHIAQNGGDGRITVGDIRAVYHGAFWSALEQEFGVTPGRVLFPNRR